MLIDLRFPRVAVRADTLAAQEAGREERDLARRLAAGDLEAVGELYDRYGAALHGMLFAMLGSTADAEDALQELFARLASGRVKRIRDLRAYLFAAARNEGVTILRRRKREAPSESGILDSSLPEGRSPDPGGEDMLRLLRRLPLEQQEVIALKVFEQMTFAEVAALLGTSPNTAASRYRYGIEKLRAWCEEETHHEV